MFNTLLQVMDDGRLTDGQGRTVDFKNTVLIMTSNIPIAGGRSATPRRATRCSRTSNPSSSTASTTSCASPRSAASRSPRSSSCRSSACSRALAERGVEVTLTDDAKLLLGNLGYDPTYGARPLRRVIQKQLTDKLALALLQGEIREGDSVTVDAREGELRIEKQGAAAPATPSPAASSRGARAASPKQVPAPRCCRERRGRSRSARLRRSTSGRRDLVARLLPAKLSPLPETVRRWGAPTSGSRWVLSRLCS